LIARIRNLNANTWDTAVISSTFPVKQADGNGFEGVSSPVMGLDGKAYMVYVHRTNYDLRIASFDGMLWSDEQIAAPSIDFHAPTLTRTTDGWYVTVGEKVGSVYQLRLYTNTGTGWIERPTWVDVSDYEMAKSGAIAPDVESSTDRFAVWSFASIHGQRFREPVSADFTATNTEGFTDLLVDFVDASTGAPDGWDWDFGDGSGHSSEQNPSHLYIKSGIFTVTLTSHTDGSTSSKTKTGYVTVYSSARVVFNPTKGRTPLEVIFETTVT